MIEQQLPLEIPPGLVMNGSLMERAGKWENGNFVRFHNGVPHPMGEAFTPTLSGGSVPAGGVPKAMYRFWTSAGGHTAVVGMHTKIYRVYAKNRTTSAVNEVDDITPSTGISDLGSAHTYAMTNLGENFLFTIAGWANGNSPLWVWPAGGALASIVDNNFQHRGVFVTPESFVMLIDELQTLRWASQGTYDDLTPAVGNSAGSLDIPTPFLAVCGRALVGESLVWTVGDLWALNYVGGDLIYGIRKIGDNCGIIGANAVATVQGVARWMGHGGFFEYDGYVRPMECPVSEYVYNDINRSYSHRFFTVHIPQWDAIQFWYISESSGLQDYCDRFVEYNIVNGTWTKGENLFRSGGIGEWPIDVFQADFSSIGTGLTAPLMVGTNGAALRLHLDTNTMESDNPADDPLGPYLRSGPLHMPEGAICKVQKILPDSAGVGDKISLYAGGFPNEAETLFGPYTVAAQTEIDTRLTARYVRYQQTLDSNDSSVGIPRLGIIPGGSAR